MRYPRYYMLLAMTFFMMHVKAQSKRSLVTEMDSSEQAGFETRSDYIINDSLYFFKGVCKNNWMNLLPTIQMFPSHLMNQLPVQDKLLAVHGNILYDFSYRSYIDTPFAQKDLTQHLVQSNFNFTIKQRYPVKLTVTNRSSNSPYFRNYTDINVQVNQQQVLDNIKAGLTQRASKLINTDLLQHTQRELERGRKEVKDLQVWVNNPARIQELVEEKERELSDRGKQIITTGKLQAPESKDLNEYGNFIKDSIGNSSAFLKTKGVFNKIQKKMDSVSSAQKNRIAALRDSMSSAATAKIHGKDSSYIQKYNEAKARLDSLKEKCKRTEQKLMLVKKTVQDSITRIRAEINRIKNRDSLYAFMQRNMISTEELTKWQKLLLSVKQVGIGRSWIDYSELTVKNVSIAGINMEITPGPYYFAFAAGKINYRFRDFIYRNDQQVPDQNLLLVRAGIGKKETNNIIATLYSGDKAVLNSAPGNNADPLQKVIGLSVEAKYSINQNTSVTAEIAKSSYLSNSGIRPTSGQLFNKVFDLSTHTNEAYSIKLSGVYPSANTKVTAYYRKVGENFQSFNLYPANINQDAWMIKISKGLWKRRLTVDASVRKNDFVSPLATQLFSSKTIFRSLQATFRMAKYPFISVGYYPSSQLSLSENQLLSESQYNTLNTIVSHNYAAGKTSMNTNAVFTRFFNNSSDTGFIYFNASSFTLNHNIFLSAFSLLSSIGVTEQKDIHLFTLEQQLTYTIKNNFSLTGGVKWNRFNRKEELIGGTAAASIYIKGIGKFQFSYDKTYLPGSYGKLVPVDMGRMNFYREF